jgi:hypothetical protein
MNKQGMTSSSVLIDVPRCKKKEGFQRRPQDWAEGRVMKFRQMVLDSENSFLPAIQHSSDRGNPRFQLFQASSRRF